MIVTDLDGTLLNDNDEISDYTLSTFEKCKEKGIYVVIATARGHSANEIIDLRKPSFSILEDGSLILDSNKNNINNELNAIFIIEKMPAIELLAKALDINLSEIVAFGDGYNDIEMIKNCGIGIAMENADEQIKEYAKFIYGNNNEDGVANWINENIIVSG